MAEIDKFSPSIEIGKPYDGVVKQFLLTRFETITAHLGAELNVPLTNITLGDLKNFAFSVARALPIYAIEQFAPSSGDYSSLRGAGYSEMMLALADTSLRDKDVVAAIKLNHEFRASANALDAVVDEGNEVMTRNDLRSLDMASGFRESKRIYFDTLRNVARENSGGDLNHIGNSARRYQMHQDLYLDLARMKKGGIGSTKYLRHIPQPAENFFLNREQTALLIVLGVDGETLLIDSSVPVSNKLSQSPDARYAAFWAATMGAMGDQWADVLQDVCGVSDNIFISTLNKFPEERKVALQHLEPLVEKGRQLLKDPSLTARLQFYQLQKDTHRVLRQMAPNAVENYGQLIAAAFNEVPKAYRDALLPVRFAAWDLVSLYQMSDFILHKDKYEDQAKARQNIEATRKLVSTIKIQTVY